MKKFIFTTTLLSALSFNATADVDTHLYNKYWDNDSAGMYNTTPDDQLGSAFASGDFNGDGYEDLAVSEPNYGEGGSFGNFGDVVILYGTGSGVSSISAPYINQATPEDGDGFGYAMAVGDFNGDGYDDLAVGAPNEDVKPGDTNFVDSGAISIFYGSSSGLPGTATEIDEFTDLFIFGNGGDYSNFGYSLAAGDIDNDGYDELAVGSPGANVKTGNPLVDHLAAGRIRVYKGGTSGITTTDFITIQQGEGAAGAPEPYDNFGRSLAMGDFNNDFFIDLAVGVPNEDLDATNDGIVQVFYGAADFATNGFGSNVIITQNDITGSAPEDNDLFGYSLAVGDVDGGLINYYDDLIIGTPFEDLGAITDAGIVSVIFGSASGLTNAGSYYISQNTTGIFGSAEQNDHFGYAVATARLSNTGIVFGESILIGAPGEDFQATNDGIAYIVYDSSASSVTSLTVSAPNPNDFANFGTALGSVTTYFDSSYSYWFTSVFVGIPGQTSADSDTDAGAFLEVVFSGNDLIFKHGFE